MSEEAERVITEAVHAGLLLPREQVWAEYVVFHYGLETFQYVLIVWETYRTQQEVRAQMGLTLDGFGGLH